jgi:serine/threonine protein kinase
VAVKVIPLEDINNEVTSYLLECELEALKATSKSPNDSIVKLEEIVVINNNCYIAMELLEGGTLKDYIAQCKKLDPAQALLILRSILQGYRILKEQGIIHRDLKPDNILFAANPQNGPLVPKIIDFGYCIVDRVQKKPKVYYNVGSPRYMSPEAYANNKYSEKTDIWSLGIIFYEMLTGTNFDKGKDIMETFKLIREKGIPIPSSLSPHCRKLLQHMLMLDPNKRFGC